MIWAGTTDELLHALDVAPAGETLQLHAGTLVAPRGGFVVPRGMRIEGAHPLRNRVRGGTIIQPASPDDHGLVIPQGVDNVTIVDVIVRGPGQAGNGDGIHLAQTGTPSCVELHDVFVWGCGRDGIHLESADHSIDLLVVDGCMSHHNGRHGLYIRNTYGANLRGGYYARNGRCGIALDGCASASLRDLSMEANQQTGPASDFEPLLWLRGGYAHNVDGCRFEDWARGRGARAAITVEDASGVRITGCSFVQPDPTPSRGILFRNHCDACDVGLNTWTHVTQRTDIDASCSGIAVRDPQAVHG